MFELDDVEDVEESISKPLLSEIPTVDDSHHNNVDDDDDASQPRTRNQRPDIESEEPRYPTRDLRNPRKWYMAGAANSAADIEITTSDEPTLREAKSGGESFVAGSD